MGYVAVQDRYLTERVRVIVVRITASLERRRGFIAWSAIETVTVVPVEPVPTGLVRILEEIVETNLVRVLNVVMTVNVQVENAIGQDALTLILLAVVGRIVVIQETHVTIIGVLQVLLEIGVSFYISYNNEQTHLICIVGLLFVLVSQGLS